MVVEWSLDTDPVPLDPPIVLDASQRLVAEHDHGPLLVLAGPGTGKTATIVESVVARMSAAVDPLPGESILVLTFGRRAAAEVRDRIMRRISADARHARASLPTVSTFHAFAYALVAGEGHGPQDWPPRLLSGAEEDVRIRELLIGGIEDGTIAWPEDLTGAVRTLGLANEIRAVLARARSLGMSGADLRRLGTREDRPAWAAIGDLLAQDEQVMLLENVCDYAELLRQAVALLEEPSVRRRMHRTFRAVYVDEYQDTDPLQVQMLRSLVGPGACLVVVGDPDQAIYGFRGASVDAILDFPTSFPRADGRPAPIVTLDTTRRFGEALRRAATAVLGDRPVTAHGSGALDAQTLRRHREPICDPDLPPGELVIESFDSTSTRAAWVAEQIRHAHVREHVPWEEMAIIVRGGAQLPDLERALLLADVPLAIAAEEIPLRAEPAVAVLLRAAEAALRPQAIDPKDAVDLLTGPMGGLDAAGIRRLGRSLRRVRRATHPDDPRATSDHLIAQALRGELDMPDPDVLSSGEWLEVMRMRALLSTAHQQIGAGTPAPDVLWTLWHGQIGPDGPLAGQRAHGWPERLRASALAGSRSANHDLDAVLALFDTAERTEHRYGGAAGVASVVASLRAQQIPAEPVVERGVPSAGVRLLTAHRAKGLQWRRVWIAGLEEGTWPDIRPRGSVLQAERLHRDGLGAAASPAELLAEERRLFYVALTRARERAVVTTVDESSEFGSQPSRFLADLPVEALPRLGRPRSPTSMTGLIAELRRVLQDPGASAALRDAAALRLAWLARRVDDRGEALVPLADPRMWWGADPVTHSSVPVRPTDQPIGLSGSALESLTTCSLRWFLDREVHAHVSRPSSLMFGSVVHAVAEYVAKGGVPADVDAMDALLDRIWHELRFEASWQSAAERAEARAALRRFLAYHLSAERTLVAAERGEEATLTVPVPQAHAGVKAGDDGEHGEHGPQEGSTAAVEIEVNLRGYIDRIEQDDHGRPVAIDLKNMKNPPSTSAIREHAQLGVYQLLLRERLGATGGAALVQLREPASSRSAMPKEQFQPALDDVSPTWIEEQLGVAAHVVRSEAFAARPGTHCRQCDFTMLCPAQPQGQQVLS